MTSAPGWPTPGFPIVAVGPLPPEAVAAIAAIGGRVDGTLDWSAVDDLASSLPRPLVVVAVSADIGHGPLEHLAAILDDAELDAIVVFEADALDAVAAVLMTPRVTLLCDATPGEWAAALAIAAHRAGAMPAAVRESGSDAERLRQMHEEVARIAAMLARLAEAPAPPASSVDDRRRSYGAEPGRNAPIEAADIRRTIRARRLRAQYFDPRLVEDPGWDMLLDLFAAELEGNQVSVSSLCIAAAVAPTTALRWIARMVESGLFARVADAGDRRRAFLTLTGAASASLRDYVGAVRRAGLPIA